MAEIPKSRQDAASLAESILHFWFAKEPGSEDRTFRSGWFFSDPEFDRLCKARFLACHEDAAGGLLDDWSNAPRSCLALVLLLDQFPRNMFRNTARAFATDAKARELSRRAIASKFDHAVPPVMRMFFYLPLEHSENLDDQLESVRLSSALSAEDAGMAEVQKYAEQHLETIRRFGRFPARNAALGRISTQAELDFLKDQK